MKSSSVEETWPIRSIDAAEDEPVPVGDEESSLPQGSEQGKKFQVDEFEIIGARVNLHTPVTGPDPVELEVADIRLTGLGQGPDGITAADLVQRGLSALLGDSTNLVQDVFTRVGEEALERAASELTEEGAPSAGGLTDGMDGAAEGLFQRN